MTFSEKNTRVTHTDSRYPESVGQASKTAIANDKVEFLKGIEERRKIICFLSCGSLLIKINYAQWEYQWFASFANILLQTHCMNF